MKTDMEIQKDVIEELKWEPFLNAAEIGVAVKNGVVTLSGTVDTFRKKTAAEEAAKSVAGVRAVAEDLEVKPAGTGRRNDAEIAQAVVNALKWHADVPDERIKIKVENGWVYLDGEVEWEFQKNAARTACENLLGVIGISNNIKILPKLKIADIKNRIMSAFHRSATIDANKITIIERGAEVTLTGTVRSFAEKKDAENAAWLAPGVTKVDNQIVINPDLIA